MPNFWKLFEFGNMMKMTMFHQNSIPIENFQSTKWSDLVLSIPWINYLGWKKKETLLDCQCIRFNFECITIFHNLYKIILIGAIQAHSLNGGSIQNPHQNSSFIYRTAFIYLDLLWARHLWCWVCACFPMK